MSKRESKGVGGLFLGKRRGGGGGGGARSFDSRGTGVGKRCCAGSLLKKKRSPSGD